MSCRSDEHSYGSVPWRLEDAKGHLVHNGENTISGLVDHKLHEHRTKRANRQPSIHLRWLSLGKRVSMVFRDQQMYNVVAPARIVAPLFWRHQRIIRSALNGVAVRATID